MKYLVSAKHVSPRFCFCNHRAVAKQSPGRNGFWFATANDLGCSKDYTTPEKAVRSLFEANACFDITLEKTEG